MGSIEFFIWRYGKRVVLFFNIIEDDFVLLLLYSICIELGFVIINDCDSIMVLNFNGFESIFGVGVMIGIIDFLDEYKDVFEGLGDFLGEYYIVIDDVVLFMVYLFRRVLVVL